VVTILADNARPQTPVHPQLSKPSVIEAALQRYDSKSFSRVEAKLMYRRDLPRANPGLGGGNPDELMWWSQSPGITESPLASAAARFRQATRATAPGGWPSDQTGPPHANEFDVSYHSEWPPFFDQLPDLSAT
jgi:hypothetical protein